MTERSAYAELWQGNLIACPLRATERLDAIRELGALMAGAPGVLDAPALVREVERREEEGSTFLGRGLALPHARSDAVDRIVAAAGTSSGGLPWGENGERAHLVIFVGVPRHAIRGYLELVSRLTKAARRPGWVDSLGSCTEAASFAAALRAAIGR